MEKETVDATGTQSAVVDLKQKIYFTAEKSHKKSRNNLDHLIPSGHAIENTELSFSNNIISTKKVGKLKELSE